MILDNYAKANITFRKSRVCIYLHDPMIWWLPSTRGRYKIGHGAHRSGSLETPRDMQSWKEIVVSVMNVPSCQSFLLAF